MSKKIDGKKCKAVIDKLIEHIEKERTTALKKELTIMMKLKSLYVQEIINWSYKENSLIIKIATIKKELKKLK